MNRSPGVTVIAVLAMIGSLLTVAVALVMALAMVAAPAELPNDFPLPPVAFKAIMLLMSFFYLLPAIWGILTSVGLLQLKNWARISIIVFAALFTAMGLFGAMSAVVMAVLPLGDTIPDHDVIVAMRIGMAAFPLVQVAIGIWWLVFFNRTEVKAQFEPRRWAFPGSVPPPPPYPPQTPYPTQVLPRRPIAPEPSVPGRPLSISIIGWYMLSVCALLPVGLIMRTPAVFLTSILTGWKSLLFILVLAGLHIYIGVGLLRLQRFARVVGMSYFAFAIVNSAVFYFAPGGRMRVQQLLQSQLAMFPWMQSAEFKSFLPSYLLT